MRKISCQESLRRKKIGDGLKLTIFRDDGTSEVDVTLEVAPTQ